MRKAFADGRVFGTTHGEPPWRVLALPGWMHTTADYDAVLAGIGAGAVAVDLPGFGGLNPEPPAVWGAAEYADFVEPVLDDPTTATAAAGGVVLVGHSRGAAVALHLAARRPQQAAALVLAGAPLLRRSGPAAKAPLAFRAARALHGKGLFPDARMEALRRRHGSADYRNAPSRLMRDVLVKVTNESYEEQLRAVAAAGTPVVILHGERDDAVPLEVAQRAAAVLGDGGRATLAVLDGVGHQVPLQAADALRAEIARHLVRT
jgi:pimeloyl-ACP methyl ester carboxylesterase